MRHAALLIVIGFIVPSLSFGCSRGQNLPADADSGNGQDELVEAERVSMGSPVHLSAWTSDRERATVAFDAAFDEFDRLDALMTVWREHSDVLRINAAAGQHPVPVHAEVREVLRVARQVSDWTGGKFDVTFGALSGLWKFDHDQDNIIPDRAAVRSRLPLIDYTQIVIDDNAGTVFLARSGMSIHLGGIGKGYAVDRAAAILRQAGIAHFMIQAGGDLYAGGRRGGRPWRLGIRDPRGPADRSFAALDLSNATFSTSGDYERFFMRDGRRYHHILDPDLGEPATRSRSVTVVSERAILADAVAKGIFILGPDAGMTLVERLPGIEAVIVGANNEVVISSGLRGRLEILAPPTDAP
jgi:thiamine biosynthesis lipoprotein